MNLWRSLVIYCCGPNYAHICCSETTGILFVLVILRVRHSGRTQLFNHSAAGGVDEGGSRVFWGYMGWSEGSRQTPSSV